MSVLLVNLSTLFLESFRTECDYFKLRTLFLEDKSCAIDLFENSTIDENHRARVDVDEYFHERWKMYETINETDKIIIQDFIIRTIPNILRIFCGFDDVYLFNEHYIVKNQQSMDSFRWHKDSEKQLAGCMGYIPKYVSVWMPLDDVNEQNGTISFPQGTNIIPIESPSHICLDNDNILACLSNSLEGEPKEDDNGLPMTAKAGQLVIFSSDMYHRSGPNSSSSDRRVFYAQYTRQIITSKMPHLETYSTSTSRNTTVDKISPLAFAIPCVITSDKSNDNVMCSNSKKRPLAEANIFE